MEQVESIPFSALIAGLLLYKKSYHSTEIANIISVVEGQGILIEDENDDFEILSCCVEMSLDYDFRLKDGLDYQTILYPNMTVSNFLMIHTKEKVFSLIENNFSNLRILSLSSIPFFQEKKEKKLVFPSKRKVLTKKNKEKIVQRRDYDGVYVVDRRTILG